MRSALAGSIPPLVTPFRGSRVDEDTFAALVERQIAEGSHGVLVNGTTAEPSSLTVDERNRLVEIAERCPVHRTLMGKKKIVTGLGRAGAAAPAANVDATS